MEAIFSSGGATEGGEDGDGLVGSTSTVIAQFQVTRLRHLWSSYKR
jgi:hypothetical protein